MTFFMNEFLVKYAVLNGNKDERGTPDRRGSPDRTVQPRPDSGHGAVFCLIRGTVRSGVQETGRVGNGVVFSRCGYFFTVRG